MIVGLSTSTFTLIHVLISLVGIGTGFGVMAGMIRGKVLNQWTAVFLITTALTSITGFMFPITHMTPGIVLGGLSMIVLAVTVAARYAFHLRKSWRPVYVITATIAQYFNVFVLIAQSFQKVPALKALAPAQMEAPFAITQLIVLIAFLWLGWLAVKGFRGPRIAAATAPTFVGD